MTRRSPPGPKRFLVTIGTFDGVHRGHQRVVRNLLDRAAKLGLGAKALVFAKPPRLFFNPGLAPRLLTTPEERAELLLGMGLDGVRVLRFSRRIREQSPRAFFEGTLLRAMQAGGVRVGGDFRFGKDRAGDAGTLRAMCRERGLAFGVEPLLRQGPKKVSSSRIRDLLEAGEVRRAASLLGRPYFLTGTVVRGRGLGRKLGFPTANLRVSREKVLPPGVYAARARWDARSLPAAVNIGTRPTVGGTRIVVEAHLPGHRGSLAGRTLRLDLLRRLRPERRFDSLAALKAQIAKDLRALKRAR